jgi:hypothetical protein
VSDYIAERVRKARKADLIRKGATEEQADAIIAREDASSREVGRRFLYGGLFMLALGLAITVGTYVAAANGGFFILTGGLIVGGVANILYGRSRLTSGL